MSREHINAESDFSRCDRQIWRGQVRENAMERKLWPVVSYRYIQTPLIKVNSSSNGINSTDLFQLFLLAQFIWNL